MNRPGSTVPLVAGAVAALVAATAAEAQTHRFHRAHVLGTSLEMTARGDRADAEAALAGALAEIARLEPLLSGWRPDSELSRLNAADGALVSPELFEVIEAAETWRRRSDGAFDGRLGRVETLWREAAVRNALPDSAAISGAALSARQAEIKLDSANRRIDRPNGAAFALDGLAKGYVVDAALKAARKAAPSLHGLMLNIGGDIAVWGDGPSGYWSVGTADPAHPEDNGVPAALIRITSGAVATSGRGPRDLDIGGELYGMRLSPRTGRPAGAVVSATVTASCAMDADALATALSVMPARAGMALIERTPGAEAMILDRQGRQTASSGWARLAQAGPAPARPGVSPPAAAGAAWPPGFAVTIDFELPRPRDTPVYSPYVTIWVTDTANRPIRQLLLQGNDFNYIDQNYLWWRRYGRSAPKMVDAMSRPTRPAGRYSAVWDGRDQDGKPVAQGRYTIHIEAIREHGQHSYQAVPLDLGTQPVNAVAMAGDELGPSRVRYGRRP